MLAQFDQYRCVWICSAAFRKGWDKFTSLVCGSEYWLKATFNFPWIFCANKAFTAPYFTIERTSLLFLDFSNLAFLKVLYFAPFGVMNWLMLVKPDNFFLTFSHRMTRCPVSLRDAEEGAPSTSWPVSQICIRNVWAGFEAVWPPDTTSAWCPTTAVHQSCLRLLPQVTGVTKECNQLPQTGFLWNIQRVRHPALMSLHFCLYLSLAARFMWMKYFSR